MRGDVWPAAELTASYRVSCGNLDQQRTCTTAAVSFLAWGTIYVVVKWTVIVILVRRVRSRRHRPAAPFPSRGD